MHQPYIRLMVYLTFIVNEEQPSDLNMGVWRSLCNDKYLNNAVNYTVFTVNMRKSCVSLTSPSSTEHTQWCCCVRESAVMMTSKLIHDRWRNLVNVNPNMSTQQQQKNHLKCHWIINAATKLSSTVWPRSLLKPKFDTHVLDRCCFLRSSMTRTLLYIVYVTSFWMSEWTLI